MKSDRGCFAKIVSGFAALYPTYHLNNLASVAFSLGHKEEALVYIRRAIALDDAYLPAHVSLAMWYVEAGMGPEAAQEFDLIVRRSPMGPDAVFARGMLSLIGQSAPGAATR